MIVARSLHKSGLITFMPRFRNPARFGHQRPVDLCDVIARDLHRRTQGGIQPGDAAHCVIVGYAHRADPHPVEGTGGVDDGRVTARGNVLKDRRDVRDQGAIDQTLA